MRQLSCDAKIFPTYRSIVFIVYDPPRSQPAAGRSPEADANVVNGRNNSTSHIPIQKTQTNQADNADVFGSQQPTSRALSRTLLSQTTVNLLETWSSIE